MQLSHAPWIVLMTAVQMAADCRVPGYREVFTFPSSPSEQIMNISMPLREFSPGNLACLASYFENRYSGRSTIVVNMFSSRWAARTSLGVLPQEPTLEDERALAQMHAVYAFDSSRRRNYIELIPVAGYTTRIDLPATKAPQCRLEAARRCIVALERPSYPLAAFFQKISGTVTVQAAISRDGTVRNVHMVKAGSKLAGVSTQLAKTAVDNLATWHFEPAPTRDAIRVTYSYVIDASLPGGSQVRVSGASPQGETIDMLF